MKEFMVKSLKDQKLKRDDDVTDQNVNQPRTTAIWLFVQTTNATLRRANEQDLGAMGQVQARRFNGQIKVQFTAVVARDARRCLLSGTQLRTKGYTFTLNQHGSFLKQPNGSGKVTMSREGNKDSLKVVCMKRRDAQSVTSLMLKRELENVRRELRNL